MRTCIGCRQRFPLASGRLVRVAGLPDGSVAIGRTLPGRGAWICGDDARCLDRALRRKALSRALRTELEPEAAAQLRSGFPASPPNARD